MDTIPFEARPAATAINGQMSVSDIDVHLYDSMPLDVNGEEVEYERIDDGHPDSDWTVTARCGTNDVGDDADRVRPDPSSLILTLADGDLTYAFKFETDAAAVEAPNALVFDLLDQTPAPRRAAVRARHKIDQQVAFLSAGERAISAAADALSLIVVPAPADTALVATTPADAAPADAAPDEQALQAVAEALSQIVVPAPANVAPADAAPADAAPDALPTHIDGIPVATYIGPGPPIVWAVPYVSPAAPPAAPPAVAPAAPPAAPPVGCAPVECANPVELFERWGPMVEKSLESAPGTVAKSFVAVPGGHEIALTVTRHTEAIFKRDKHHSKVVATFPKGTIRKRRVQYLKNRGKPNQATVTHKQGAFNDKIIKRGVFAAMLSHFFTSARNDAHIQSYLS
jgi:hypothetical protein